MTILPSRLSNFRPTENTSWLQPSTTHWNCGTIPRCHHSFNSKDFYSDLQSLFICLFSGQMLENLHRPQKRKILHLCQFLGDWRKGTTLPFSATFLLFFYVKHVFLFAVDRFRLWRQHGLYLELANKGDCSKTSRTHRYGFLLGDLLPFTFHFS